MLLRASNAFCFADSSPASAELLALTVHVLTLRRTKRFRNRFLSAVLATLLPCLLADTYFPLSCYAYYIPH
jgi:hypothetical protein